MNAVEQWSRANKLQLNADKCKEMIIDFKIFKHKFNALSVNSKDLQLVDHAKVLGITISNTLQWNYHISEVIKKANKRLYFLILLKRARVPINDMIIFYSTCIRPVLEYCAPLYRHALPAYLSDDLEIIQKRALSIISPGPAHHVNLGLHSISSLKDTRSEQYSKLFQSVIDNDDHKLYHLLPPKHISKHNLRHQRQFHLPKIQTNRFKNTFIQSMANR